MLVVVVAASSCLAVLSLDVVRLGPSSVTLSPGALSLHATWYRIRDGDPDKDYYGLVATLSDGESDPAVQPYAVTVNLTFPGAQWGGPMWPGSGDFSSQRLLSYDDGVGMGPMTVDLPQGAVHLNMFLRDGFVWTVQGERLLRSQPIFVGHADFLLDTIVVPENATMHITVNARLDWFFVNLVQAYPVATSDVTATCLHAPAPNEEHNVTTGACS